MQSQFSTTINSSSCSAKGVFPGAVLGTEASSPILLCILRDHRSGTYVPCPCYLAKWQGFCQVPERKIELWLYLCWKILIITARATKGHKWGWLQTEVELHWLLTIICMEKDDQRNKWYHQPVIQSSSQFHLIRVNKPNKWECRNRVYLFTFNQIKQHLFSADRFKLWTNDIELIHYSN